MSTMKVKTAEPLTMAQIIMLTGRDALIEIDGYKCRIINASPGQEIEVDMVCNGWGLRRVNKPKYEYLAMRVK